jgi:hypothetical protein
VGQTLFVNLWKSGRKWPHSTTMLTPISTHALHTARHKVIVKCVIRYVNQHQLSGGHCDCNCFYFNFNNLKYSHHKMYIFIVFTSSYFVCTVFVLQSHQLICDQYGFYMKIRLKKNIVLNSITNTINATHNSPHKKSWCMKPAFLGRLIL